MMNSITNLLIAIRIHSRIRPVGMRNVVRVLIGYLAAIPLQLLRPVLLEHLGLPIPGKTPVTVSVNGILARARPRTNDLSILVSSQEPKSSELFSPKRGDIFIDVGAHIGTYSLSAAKSGSTVVAIEPDPSNYQILIENIRLNHFSNVTALNIAINDQSGSVLLYPAHGGNKGMSSLDKRSSGIRSTQRQQPIAVRCETLDQLAAEIGINRVDWMKIDVEGRELSVLRAGGSILAKTRSLLVEISRGHEQTCHRLLANVGLFPRSVEGELAAPARNWYFLRK